MAAKKAGHTKYRLHLDVIYVRLSPVQLVYGRVGNAGRLRNFVKRIAGVFNNSAEIFPESSYVEYIDSEQEYLHSDKFKNDGTHRDVRVFFEALVHPVDPHAREDDV